MTKKIFWNVQEAVEWLNEKDVDYTNFEDIISNYDLEVVGMNSLRYKSDEGNFCLAFFELRKGRFDFIIVEIGCCAFVKDLSDMVDEWVEENFFDIAEKFYRYLDIKPLKKGENVLRVFENWYKSNEVCDYDYIFRGEKLIRLYEYNVLMETAYGIAKNYANKKVKVNGVIEVDV